jgi:TM2 domain.
MKKVFTLIFAIVLSLSAFAGNYTVDEEKIDELFASASVVTFSEIPAVDFSAETPAVLSAENPNPWVAWALTWVVGCFGVHRMYLGSQDLMWLYYTITCGGIFGIVTTVDWVVLLIGAIENDITKYVNNPKFFMWM